MSCSKPLNKDKMLQWLMIKITSLTILHQNYTTYNNKPITVKSFSEYKCSAVRLDCIICFKGRRKLYKWQYIYIKIFEMFGFNGSGNKRVRIWHRKLIGKDVISNAAKRWQIAGKEQGKSNYYKMSSKENLILHRHESINHKKPIVWN